MATTTNSLITTDFDDDPCFKELFELLQGAHKAKAVEAKCAGLSFLSAKAAELSRKIATGRSKDGDAVQ